MSPAVARLIGTLKQRQDELEKEVATLRQRLQYSHTTINDLRYTKRVLTEKLTQSQQLA